LSVLALLGACSNIIGVSSYDIDPALDESGGAPSSGGSKSSNGGKGNGGDGAAIEAGAPAAAGDGTGVGGSAAGESSSAGQGGKASGGSPDTGGAGAGAGESSTAGDGMGGAPNEGGCESAADCDDTIDCTTDTCNASGVCVHTPNNTLCDGAKCETCQAGIGCVAGPKTTTPLLLDPNFDLTQSAWEDIGDTTSIVTAAGAQSGTKVAKFGPAATNAEEQLYGDILQYLTVPEGTVGITLTGYYKLAPGTELPADDYLVFAIYADGETQPFAQFHSFEATIAAQTAWKAFSYNLSKTEVAGLAGTNQEYTFDVVAHVWDTVFQVDTLQLNATVCQ